MVKENVIDVDEDDVLIIDGLTKRFRLPGWRVAWIIGPKEFIKALVPPFHPPLPTTPTPINNGSVRTCANQQHP